MGPVTRRSCLVGWLVVATVAGVPSMATLALAQAPVSAKAHLAAGARAAQASRWEESLAEYQAAQAAGPSAEGSVGEAEALYALRRDVEAYNAFRAALATYGARLSKAAQANARARITALEHVTGTLTVTVTVPGAAVTVDTAPVGTSPLASPVRLSSGLHRVRATKVGYADAEALPTVIGGQDAAVALVLNETKRTGHVAVRTSDGASATLVVDGTERGPLPWEGDLDAGAHDLVARSADRSSAHQTIDVLRGQSVSLVLSVTTVKTAVHLATADRRGLIAVDGAVMGEGELSGQLTVGEHVVRITRAGYDSLERHVVLREGESYTETFTLTPEAAVEHAVTERPYEGVLGGIMLAGAFQTNGLNGDFSEPCSFASTPSAASCSAGSPAGGAIMGYVGYTANPVGVDVLVGGQLDTANVSLTVQGAKSAESFTTPRIGGFIAPRARVGAQTGRFRFSAAAGVGLAVRQVSLASSGLSAITGGDPSATYIAPAITFEGTVHLRVAPKVALGAGVMYWAESAGSGVTLASGPYLTQPAVVLSAVQAMVLPFIALELGP